MFGRLVEGLSSLLFPCLCLVCKQPLPSTRTPPTWICRGCWGKISRNHPPFCRGCGRNLGTDRRAHLKHVCCNCIKHTWHYDRAFSPCMYEGVLKELIHEFKYNRRRYLAKPLSVLMSSFIKEYSLPVNDIDCIIPVPLHPVRLREREFNQACALGESISKEFNKPLITTVLHRTRYTSTQTEMTHDKRFLNVENCFTIKNSPLINKKNIFLIDDVLTTGSTSSEAARMLKTAGAHIVFVLTLAN